MFDFATTTFALSLAAGTASSTGFIGPVVLAMFNGFFNLLYTILPYAIGILVFFIGYQWARRALGGR